MLVFLNILTTPRYARNMFVNEDATAMWVSVVLDWDPIDQNGFNWLDVARNELSKQERLTNGTFYLTGAFVAKKMGLYWVWFLLFFFSKNPQ